MGKVKRRRKKKKQRKLKKRHLIFIGIIAILFDVIYSYTENIRLIFMLLVILIAFLAIANLGAKIGTGNGFSSENTGGFYY